MCASKSRGFGSLFLYCAMRVRIFPIEEISALVYTPRWLPQDFRLQMFYGLITEEENRNLPLEPDAVEIYDVFLLARNNFQGWLRVWKMVLSEGHENNKDLLVFSRETKAKFTDLIGNEIKEFKSAKVSFGPKAKFSIERNGETQHMEHYFSGDEPHLLNRYDEDKIKIEFYKFVERTNGEIEV